MWATQSLPGFGSRGRFVKPQHSRDEDVMPSEERLLSPVSVIHDPLCVGDVCPSWAWEKTQWFVWELNRDPEAT